MKRWLPIVALLVIPRGTRAEVPYGATYSVFDEHLLTIATVIGIGTPTGELGIEVTAAPTPYFELSGGIGRGFYGPQLAAMPRLRLPGRGHWAFTFGVGYSQGEYGDFTLFCFDGPCPLWRGTIQWANVEAGGELQLDGGFTLRVFGGVDLPLNPDGLRCIDNGSNDCAYETHRRVVPFPSTGVAIGWSF